jgi:hypothetical protein
MRPQDIIVLLKIIAKGEIPWQGKDLAAELFISPAEISDSLQRSVMGHLLNSEKKKVYRQTFLEFIEYGLHVVFPVLPGTMENGLYTAHSHPFMQQFFTSELNYVWPDAEGIERGLSIQPLYKEAVKAARVDAVLYEMMALLDVVRVGRVREFKIAMEELKRLIAP